MTYADYDRNLQRKLKHAGMSNDAAVSLAQELKARDASQSATFAGRSDARFRVRPSQRVKDMNTAAVMTTAPVFTYSASLFAGYVDGANKNTAGWPNGTALRSSGAPLAPPNQFNATYFLGPLPNDSSLNIYDGAVHVDFVCPDQTFVFRTQITATARFRLWVNGQPHAAAPVMLSSIAAVSGSAGYIKVDFGSRLEGREVSIELAGIGNESSGTPLPFYGVWKETAGTILPPPASARLAVIGDSYAKGIGAGRMDLAYPVQLGRLLGITDTHHYASLASHGVVKGYDETPQSNHAARLAQVININPDVVLYQGSINDGASWPLYQAQIKPMAKADLAALKSALPNAVIIATGPLYVLPLTGAYAGVDTEMSAAASESGVPYISIAGYFTGTGRVGATTGDGNADYYRASAAVDSSGSHPSADGHLALARLLASKIAPLIGA